MAYMTAAPRAWVSSTHTPEARPSCDVFEADDRPINTGILSADGTPIYRVADRVPFGFQPPNRRGK